MSSKTWRTMSGVLAVAAVTFLAKAAWAGNIRGAWDPQFNGTFSSTGFLGEVVFFVPDACLGNGTPSTFAYFADIDGCSANGMYLVSAEVSLYNFPNTASIINTITFAPPVQSPDPILGIRVEYSAAGVPTVIGLDTNPIGPQPSGVATSVAPSPLYLVFASGDVESPYGNAFFAPLNAGAYLLPQTCSLDGDIEFCFPNFSVNERSNPGQVAYTPEPGSVALLLSAFGAGWLVRRRKVAS